VKKVVLSVVAILFACVLLVGSFSAGFVSGHLTSATTAPGSPAPAISLPSFNPAPATEPADTAELFAPFWETWQIVHERYVDQPIDDVALMRGALRGMLEALGDQHTSYMDPEQYETANMDLRGDYEGIGAWVDPTQEYLTIISPMEGSPAQKAGLKPKDQIVAVDGDDMTGVPGELVIRRVLGPSGSKVILTIRREGVPEPFDVEITRARIIVPSVTSKMLDNDIAYVQITTFGDKTSQDLRDQLRDLLAQNPRGMVLDLRNNTGGWLTTAIQVTSQFIGDGVIMYEVYGNGARDTYRAERGGLATEIPLVVLINEGSASASEILAGAIQDYDRGKLVGVTSFGKGSVQSWISLQNGQGAVRVTIARWLTPKERTIHEVGIEPDLIVEISDEDILAERDPQLDKALEVLETLISK
jgi:carboxyl-terminal processing protease